MPDNIQLNAGTGGQIIRALDDGTQVWPAGITSFATTVGTPDVCQVVTPLFGLPVRLADGSGYISTLPVSLASVPSHAVTNAGTFAVQASQTGTWTVDLGATDNAVLDAIAASLAGTLTVGSHAVTNAGTFAVQAAQSGTWNITNVSGTISLPTGAATAAKQPALGTAGAASSDVLTVQGIASMTALKVDGSAVTQPVSAASLPLPSGAATAANQATEIAHLSTIAGAVSGTEVQVDVLTMPTVTVSDGGGAITVDGTVTANAGTGTFAVSAASLPLPTGAATLAEQQSQTTALQLIDDSVATTGAAITAKGIAAVGTDGTNARILKTDASGELQVDVLTMPTITANLGTIADVATQTTLAALNTKVTAVDTGAVVVTTLPALPAGTNNIGDVDVLSLPALAAGDNAIGRVKLTDGTDVADVLDLANANPLTVAIVDGSGDQITAFGGGTQYTEGDTDASITGTAFLWEDTGDTLRAVSAAKPLPIGDAGGSLTVDNGGTFAVQAAQSGSWTVDLGATDNAVLDTIAASLAGTLTVGSHAVTNAGTFAVQAAQSGTWNITNVSGTISLPTGAATLAEQQTQTTALQLLDDAVATTGSAITAKGIAAVGTDGTNARILKTDASGELQVDVLSMPTTTVTGTVAATQSGTWTVTGTGGTFPVTDSGGSLTVDAPVATPVFVRLSDGASAISTLPVSLASVPSHAVTNAGTFAVQVDGAALTALQLIDNPVVVDDAAFTPATTSVMMAGFTFDDVSPDTVNEGDAGAARMSANRCQYVVLRDNAGNERGLNIDASGQLAVTLASAQTLATVTTVSTLTGGGIAHDSPDSGNPVKVGARAAATLSDDTMVANADRADNVADLDGALIVRPQFPLGDLISERVSDTGGSSTAFTNFGATASTRNYVTAISVYNSSGTAGYIDFRDGTAGSVLWTVAIPAGGGAVIGGNLPLFRTSANTALAYDVSGALTTVYISVSGFKSKV